MTNLDKEVKELSDKWNEKVAKTEELEEAFKIVTGTEADLLESRNRAISLAESILMRSVSFLESKRRSADFLQSFLPDIPGIKIEESRDLSISEQNKSTNNIDIDEDMIWNSQFTKCAVMSSAMRNYAKSNQHA
jgi:hypothetical protein